MSDLVDRHELRLALEKEESNDAVVLGEADWTVSNRPTALARQ
jgi:hypothetical protein